MAGEDETCEAVRVARLMDYVDAEEEEDDQDLEDMLQALKTRNSFYVHELNTLYEAYCPQTAEDHKDLVLERLFSTGPVYDYLDQSPNINPKSKTTRKEPAFTVPQPFHMTVREAEKRVMKSPAWADPRDAQNDDNAECLKQFRAQPVPAHVLLPLYNEIMEQNEERRKSAVQHRIELLVSMQKPFRFLAEERRRQAERPVTTPAQKEQNRKKTIPKSVLDPTVSDQLREAELLRKINSQIRAQDLLQSSCAPVPLSHGTRHPHSRTALKSKQRHLGFLQQNPTFHPRTNPAIPDFQALYRNFQKLSLKNQSVSESTVSEPFYLRTSSLNARKRRSRTENVQDSPQDSRPLRYSSHLSSLSPNTLPVCITDTTKRREVAIRTSLQDRDHQDTERETWLRKHRENSLRMQKSLSTRAKALDPHKPLADTNKEKLRQNRQSERKRAQEYKAELEQMKNRVRTRAYLFEGVTKGCAIKEVESRFTRTLQQAGLTEDFVQQKGRTDRSGTESDDSRQEEAEPL